MQSVSVTVHWLDWGLWRQSLLPFKLGRSVKITTGLAPCPIGTPYIGWGLKRSGLRARALSSRHQRDCWLLEDGFLRSLGGSTSPSWSLVIDDVGIYYDATRPSKLEQLIPQDLDSVQAARVKTVLALWRRGRVSKYNHAPDIRAQALPTRYVLVVDQTFGDKSISAGLADASVFQAMVDDALARHTDCQVVLKVHPETIAGKKRGHFDLPALSTHERVTIISQDIHAAALLENAEAVYTVTSQMGFEALLWGKPVYVYGMPFYAGWGLTIDRLPAPDRRGKASLEQLTHAALIDYARYIDPQTLEPCAVEVLISWLALQRHERGRFSPELLAYGFSRWKRGFVREFLAGSHITFTDDLPKRAQETRPLVTWGHKHATDIECQGYGREDVLRIEDGFIRSVGLGAELIRPLSWVIDRTGIYYDAQQPSDLETLLSKADFDAILLDRAASLRTSLIQSGITKYNLQNQSGWIRPSHATHVVLVVGQVETDASIMYGAATIKKNVDLLKAVRQQRPDAYIVYKPHPDVAAGLRNQGDGENQAYEWCDEIVSNVSFHVLMEHIDEIHVLTSLAGFEALLRNIPVTTWGQPFYAGWGLTTDQGLSLSTAERRVRTLTIEQLVAATLILYPTYVSRKTRYFCSVEDALAELLDWRKEPYSHPIRKSIAKLFRKP